MRRTNPAILRARATWREIADGMNKGDGEGTHHRRGSARSRSSGRAAGMRGGGGGGGGGGGAGGGSAGKSGHSRGMAKGGSAGDLRALAEASSAPGRPESVVGSAPAPASHGRSGGIVHIRSRRQLLQQQQQGLGAAHPSSADFQAQQRQLQQRQAHQRQVDYMRQYGGTGPSEPGPVRGAHHHGRHSSGRGSGPDHEAANAVTFAGVDGGARWPGAATSGAGTSSLGAWPSHPSGGHGGHGGAHPHGPSSVVARTTPRAPRWLVAPRLDDVWVLPEEAEVLSLVSAVLDDDNRGDNALPLSSRHGGPGSISALGSDSARGKGKILSGDSVAGSLTSGITKGLVGQAQRFALYVLPQASHRKRYGLPPKPAASGAGPAPQPKTPASAAAATPDPQLKSAPPTSTGPDSGAKASASGDAGDADDDSSTDNSNGSDSVAGSEGGDEVAPEEEDPSRLPARKRVFVGTDRHPLPFLASVGSTGVARRLAMEAFDRLDWQRHGVVSYDSLTSELHLDEDVAEKLFERLEFSVTKSLTRRELALLVSQVLRDWTNLGKTLENYSSVTQALRIAVYSVWGVAVAMSALLIFNLSILEIIVPVSTVVVALSFALGEPTRQLVLSVLLLAVYQPFEIGDRVYIQGESQYVHRITLLGTWFRTFHNKLKWIPNHLLANLVIENHRRSKDAVVELHFPVGYRTTAEQIDKLTTALTHWIRAHPAQWRPETVELYVYTASPGSAEMKIAVWLQHRLAWQDGLSVYSDIGKVNVFMMQAMVRLGIEFIKPVQPVTMAPPAVLAPSMRATAGTTPDFERMWHNGAPASGMGSSAGMPPPAGGAAQAPSQPQGIGPSGRPSGVDQAAAEWVPLPYDECLMRTDPGREASIQRFDAKRFGSDFVDIRTGPVASTWTWRLNYADRARQALRKRYAEGVGHGEIVA
ncbi:hypothetical protein FNF28_02015 [Cafeteria roenbergensis]|uniref:Mechanosensitive ion channel MscS domain-containing protein n=1 Tax=Cafeteria roenbergensis TaxID=33653 RepID=A0A5A8E0W2_CAFRO|nr:hypothetical protein FNF28_02015 [Cafeteria roenbergensis]